MYDVHPPLNQNQSATPKQGGAQQSQSAQTKTRGSTISDEFAFGFEAKEKRQEQLALARFFDFEREGRGQHSTFPALNPSVNSENQT